MALREIFHCIKFATNTAIGCIETYNEIVETSVVIPTAMVCETRAVLFGEWCFSKTHFLNVCEDTKGLCPNFLFLQRTEGNAI